MTFMAFSVLEGFEELPLKSDRLCQLWPLGFTVCHYLKTNKPLNQMWTEKGIEQLKQYAKENDIPIDGIVITFNDIAYSKACGRTGHHYQFFLCCFLLLSLVLCYRPESLQCNGSGHFLLFPLSPLSYALVVIFLVPVWVFVWVSAQTYRLVNSVHYYT